MLRKDFLKYTAASPLLLAPQFLPQGDTAALPPELVEEFIGASHGKIDVVKELLPKYPNLVYSAWDWGNGDFESCLEAAGHVGNKEMAFLLLEHGARITLPVMTMLGQTDLVIPILEAYPSMLTMRGAHGFSLLHHAQKGREDAADILAYLTEKGLTETKYDIGK
jgi:hypothetical protein